MKKCPYCAEEIQDEAIKCRHCGEFLDGSRPQASKDPWYTKTSVIVLLLLSLGPLALPLVWINRKWDFWVKFIITIAVCILAFMLWQASVNLMKQLNESLSAAGLSL